ncbi:WGR domain-containing protein [Aerosakkonemataceae cyanobacterium BLCC-F50]|uniref:WGR domain-containing protein n=1 Tax=Floridaenema flaviceps BLCC-F50 TaxID=3153642 RepID=A0ABV4XI49_9CYAN
MQLIKRTTLHYQEGTSDKVYEVDLCLVGSDRYVVNFRYGRRGASLKEGVKTEQPVTLAQAEKVFDKLVSEKTKKGYQDVSSTIVTETTAPKTLNPPNPDSQKQAILTRLAAPSNKKWPLERVIWRAGELKITEAVPELLKLIGTGEPLRDYCIAWALGNCGDRTALPTLKNLYQNPQNPEFVRRISWEAAFKLSEETEKENLRSQKIAELPKLLQETAKNGSATEFANLLKAYLQSCDYQGFAVLDTIYQINNENVRPALLEILRTAPFKPNYFKQVRHIFKVAEYRLDAEVFGIIAYRVEKEKANFRSDRHLINLSEGEQLVRYGYKYNSNTRRWDKVDRDEVLEELKSSNSRIAYSNFTRQYLQKRLWRTLRELGEIGDDNYVKMAASILLQYSDRDAQPAKQINFSRWQRFNNNWQTVTISKSWDIYAGYLTFNHILYENSHRYEYRENNKAWLCKENYKPGDPEPNVREEAFPKLWEQQPTELLNLLLESNCQPVHQFAIKALRECSQFCTELDTATIIKLLNKPYEITARFAFELAQRIYNSAAPNLELVLALASCVIPEARTVTFRWIEETREPFLADANFITALVTNPFADTRQFARQLLNSSILDENAAKFLIVKIITEVLALPNDAGEKAKDIAETLLTCFTPQLRTLGMSIIQDLLRHPVLEVQELGARILVNHETSAENLPPGLIDSLIVSQYESIRGLGIRIFGQLPDSTLLNQYSLLMAMATHELADIRNAIRPVIRRLAVDHSDFAARLATEIIDVLMTAKTKEEVCQYLVRFLKEDLPEWMTNISKDTALRLLKAKSSATQELAGYVIIANADNWAEEFETMEIVKLADNEILAVREAARQILLKNLPRLRGNEAEMLSGVRIVESKWEDTQEFGFRLFNTFFTAEDLTPSVLITLCDSIKEEVRSFGRNLVTGYFQEADGQEYLLKFSEHPATDMQLFVTNYLENYAVNDPEKLEELTPYFITVLSLVNRGSVAKKRIFAFLNGEAQKSLEAATVVAEIMTRQSATMVIADKAAAIECMVNIKRTYPDLELPILVKEFKTAEERR